MQICRTILCGLLLSVLLAACAPQQPTPMAAQPAPVAAQPAPMAAQQPTPMAKQQPAAYTPKDTDRGGGGGNGY
jgi:hypothetical protein